MATVQSNQITFVDITDSRKLDIYISSNLPTTQIYNSNTGTYSPDWRTTNLKLIADIYLDSEKITLATIEWYTKGGESPLSKNSDLTIDTNVLSNYPIITYICKATYQGLSAFTEITFMRADTGKDGIGVTILGSFGTLTELQSAHPTGNPGDSYIVDGDLYVWAIDNAQWENVGNLQGPKGDQGEGAKNIILSADSQVFRVDKDGIISPAKITITAQNINTNINSWTYSTNGGLLFTPTLPNGVIQTDNQIEIDGTKLASNSLVIKASDGNINDTLTVYKAYDGVKGSDGAPASIAFLTNENVTFAANDKGQISSTSFNTSVVTYKGATKVAPTIGSVTGLPNGMTYTSSTSGNEIALSFTIADNSTLGSTSSNNGTITIPVTNPVNTNLKLSWSKVNSGTNGEDGKPGSDAYTVILTNESHVFTGDTSSAIAGSTSTQVLAYKGSISQSVTVVSVNGMNASTNDTATGIAGLRFQCSALSGMSPTITFTCTTAFKNANGSIPIVLSVDGVTFTKMFTYSIAFKGERGETGEPGTSPSSYWLISSADVVHKTSTGTIAVTPSTLTFTGKRQTGTESPINYACRWKIAYSNDGTNYTDLYTSTVDEASKSITVLTTYKTIRTRMYMAGSTTTLIDEQIIPVVSDGATGPRGVGVKSTTVTYGVSDSASTRPADTAWQSTIPVVAEGKYLWTRTIIDYTDDAVADTVTYTYAKQGTKGDTGSSGSSVAVSSIQYQEGTSATTTPTGTWSNSVVAVAEGKYLWTKTAFSDGKTAYGVAKQGAAAVTFQIYAPNGYLLTKGLESLTLQTFAYEGSNAITSSATYQWAQYIEDAWENISGATTQSLVVTKDEVVKSKSYKCTMTYKSKQYTATATVQDKTDIYDSLIQTIAKYSPTNKLYWVLYSTVYTEEGEKDKLLGPVSTTAPTSPATGAYWYKIDETNYTVTLMKYSGTAWAETTDKQELAYDWFLFNDVDNATSLGSQNKVKIITSNDFNKIGSVQCNVFDSESTPITYSNQILTDPSDPVVSSVEPIHPVHGQLWIKTGEDGLYTLLAWDASLEQWIVSETDSRVKVHISKPTSYAEGDVWVVGNDYEPVAYVDGVIQTTTVNGVTQNVKHLAGTMLKAQYPSTSYKDSDWKAALNYKTEIDGLKEKLDVYNQFFTFDKTGMTMRAKNIDGQISEFSTKMTNQELGFYQGENKVAHINNNQLNISKAEITNGMTISGDAPMLEIGNFVIIQESNGSLSIGFKG